MRPELFQSNCAAGTSSIDLCPLILSLSTVLNVDDVDDDVTFMGSNGLKPKFAANFGAELFHFSPYNCK